MPSPSDLRLLTIEAFLLGKLEEIMRIETGTIIPTSALKENAAWDSLAALQLLMAIEQEYGLEIDPPTFFDLPSASAMTEMIAGKVAK